MSCSAMSARASYTLVSGLVVTTPIDLFPRRSCTVIIVPSLSAPTLRTSLARGEGAASPTNHVPARIVRDVQASPVAPDRELAPVHGAGRGLGSAETLRRGHA